MTKVLVIHGAGMNMRGKAQIEVFGTQTLDDYNRQIQSYADQLGVSVELFHSNVAGEVADAFYRAHYSDVDAAIINPAGFMAGAPAPRHGHRPGALPHHRGARLQSRRARGQLGICPGVQGRGDGPWPVRLLRGPPGGHSAGGQAALE